MCHWDQLVSVRDRLESVRKEYFDLLDSLSAEDWKAKSANHAWTVGQLMWHLGRGMEFFSQNVEFDRVPIVINLRPHNLRVY